MKALVKKHPERGLWFEDVPEPATGVNDVKIKIHKTAICGTDLHIYNWDEWSQKTIRTPRVIGHEYVGKIVEVGANVTNWKIGDIVSGEGHIVCGKCRNCLAGNGHLCKDTVGVGVDRDGAFAEYLVIPQENVRGCENDIPEEMYAIFDPFGNAVHTALSFDLTGEDVLITGAGPIGIMAAAVCKHVGARRVVITDINDERLKLANTLGIQYTVNTTKESLAEVMKNLSIREGFDVGLEMSGSEIALNTMIDHMIHGGKIALLGILKSDSKFDWSKIIFNGLIIKGIYGRQMHETWYKMSAMLQGGLDISNIITHRMDIKDYEKGFEAMNSGKSGKVILDWTTLH
ncbi:MAG: L-threonine 3-dehydrogenase [Oscillospiraceae bacterium]|nr:L-threonine 3-dehydrogenase [Oscillospiraceae bacterium]